MRRDRGPCKWKRKRNRYRFTRADCRKGYQAALAKCSQNWDLGAWFYYRIRGWYRAKKRAI
jgi:hypothetical protein